MPRHEDMDFPHAAAWCDDCWGQEQQGRMLAEMRRANDLKDQELFMRQEGEWVDAKPRPRPTYVLPPPQQPVKRGGIRVDPRKNPV
jgi:hypothetical protein